MYTKAYGQNASSCDPLTALIFRNTFLHMLKQKAAVSLLSFQGHYIEIAALTRNSTLKVKTRCLIVVTFFKPEI